MSDDTITDIRHRLPNRRASETLTLTCSGETASFSRFELGGIAELFFDMGAPGSDSRAIGRDGAILISLLLQHKVPANVILDSLTKDDQGRPATSLGKALAAAIAHE
jgi:hypothetical protein